MFVLRKAAAALRPRRSGLQPTRLAHSMYDSRKYGHGLPGDCTAPCFEPLRGVPTGVFRCTACETLGRRGAAKGGCYQNPEYFSFQHMSYYDLLLALQPCRRPRERPGRKP